MLFIKYLLGSIFICFLLTQISYFSDFFFIIWGVLLLLGALTLTRYQLLALFAISLAIIINSFDFSIAFYYVCLSLAVFVMSMHLTAKSNYETVRQKGIITAVLAISFYLASIFFMTGSIGEEAFQKELQASFQSYIPFYEQHGVFDQLATEGVSREDMENDLQSLAITISKFLPSVFYLQALFTVFFMVLIASNLSKRVPEHAWERKPYYLEIMPWQLVWLVIAALALWLWGRYGQPLAGQIGSNLIVIMLPIAVYFGFSAISWRIKALKPKARIWIAATLIVIGVIILPSAIVFLALIGVFDALLDYRKLRSGKGDAI